MKGSVDADFDLLGQCPGLGKDGQNNTKTLLLVTFPQKISNPKQKTFFFHVN